MTGSQRSGMPRQPGAAPPSRAAVRKLVLNDPGQTRFSFDIDYNGTPSDPADDVEIPDSFQVVRDSTGRNDTAGRDFCADLVEFTS
jgi:hypothetical protein